MTQVANDKRTHIPGEVGIWLFLAGDMLMFSLLFYIFLHYRAADPVLFTESQAHLNQTLGMLNTILMLTSSWLVASGVRAARCGDSQVVRRCFKLAIGCGVAFLAVKYFEYSEKISAGLNMWSNDFFMLYFCYTGIHMIHVVLGIGVLAGIMSYARTDSFAGNAVRNIETGATFWHLVDLLWIVLFGLIYLVGQS